MTYVQVTVLITSIDAGWTFSLLLVAEYTGNPQRCFTSLLNMFDLDLDDRIPRRISI